MRTRPHAEGALPPLPLVVLPDVWFDREGKDGKSAIGTLVERATRYVMLLHLPDDHGAEAVDLRF
ncbi:hypothetical protein HMPREF1486_02500 [Streptomyces sp. HPH0547]|nr:hypothetical protein HMPREF1486_02500 [Streptomyces sp. HPH0547]